MEPLPDSDADILAVAKELGCDCPYWGGYSILEHGQIIARAAEAIAHRIAANGHPVNVTLVRQAALVHDIGWALLECDRDHPLVHGWAGAQVLRQQGFDDIANIVECHIMVGISAQEIVENAVPLPPRDFLLDTLEAKIVCYADKLAHTGIMAGTESISGGFIKDETAVRARLAALEQELCHLAGCDVRREFAELAEHPAKS